MIVLNNTDKETEHMSTSESKTSLEELFRKELDAYCAYKEWADETDDNILEMGLEEIMLDEYLHAKFLRDYMIDKHMYNISANDPHEKKYWKIHRRLFDD